MTDVSGGSGSAANRCFPDAELTVAAQGDRELVELVFEEVEPA